MRDRRRTVFRRSASLTPCRSAAGLNTTGQVILGDAPDSSAIATAFCKLHAETSIGPRPHPVVRLEAVLRLEDDVVHGFGRQTNKNHGMDGSFSFAGEVTRCTMPIRRVSSIAAAAVLFLSTAVGTETLPRTGTFTGYFFVDRWGQGVFDIFFVEPSLHETISKRLWRPIRLTTDDIRQPMNPGAGMIHQITRLEEVVEPPLNITLALDSRSLKFGEHGRLHVTVRNSTEQPVELYRRDFHLRTTVNKRGVDPERQIERDSIYDSMANPYGFAIESKCLLRATMSTALFTNDGDIRMREGAPALFVARSDGDRPAGLYDEQRPMLQPGQPVDFMYAIGAGWLVNEYELQISYRPRENTAVPNILSPPLSVDVTARE